MEHNILTLELKLINLEILKGWGMLLGGLGQLFGRLGESFAGGFGEVVGCASGICWEVIWQVWGAFSDREQNTKLCRKQEQQ